MEKIKWIVRDRYKNCKRKISRIRKTDFSRFQENNF